jgi:glycosyltransferase involved in cell wall biosynthesis
VTIGYYAPLPPARTGVADYAQTLLDALRKHGRVDVNAGRADICLYHLGNNQLHRAIYQRAIVKPGVVVIHDAVLQHFFLGSLTREQYIAEFTYNYGEWARDLATDLWNNRARSAADPRCFDHPMLRRIAERSLAIVVHNPAAAEMVRAHNPSANIVEIPHLFEAPAIPSFDEIRNVRAELGISEKTFLFGVFGHLRESKRVLSVLRSFAHMRSGLHDVALLIAGECVSSDLERAMQPWLTEPGVIRRGYVDVAQFWRHVYATDACINLRYPLAGETSGIAIRFMGCGRPVVMTRSSESSRLPDTACLKVETGLLEEPMLMEYMIWLSRFRNDATEIGLRGEAHIREHHNIDAVARRYWDTLVSLMQSNVRV